ncbi:hypothetical protein P3T36_003533 [Kitasatospora sp. MAP12-15]|uniref:SCO2583 family membrane protein n=1 Tax=unclassified Kitasatospora TaxID=2633591 RepID=UPI0024753A2A|nr:hypothetical protein [Kitasatospora sp. MAP12-44]MDH6110495.1 hypothetical protein [Kitasatospora sp. MAP12-44]
MGDPGVPPDGAPEGGSGSDDEYRSVVFDESFVRAARIQELSANERLGGGFAHPVRRRIGLGALASLPRQALTLLLLIVLAFSAAVYFGVSAPREGSLGGGTQLTADLTALAPAGGSVAAVDAAAPFASLPASAGYADGDAGLGLPTKASTAHFTQSDVSQALQTVQRYLDVSELNPQTLIDGSTTAVRSLLAPSEQGQFDAGVASPTDDQHHALTGWMVRFDPTKVALASNTVKAAGTVKITELNSSVLEITSDDSLVYALHPAGTAASGPVSLYSVRREVRIDMDRADIGAGQLQLIDSVLQAGPTACGAAQATYLQPLMAGSTGPVAGTPGAVNPADRSQPAWQQCGVLAPTTTAG